MAKKTTFEAPAAPANYSAIQSTAPAQQAPAEPAKEAAKEFRFNAKFPAEFKVYLQEMAWRKSLEEHKTVSVTEYITRLIRADMEAHPQWTATLDELNS